MSSILQIHSDTLKLILASSSPYRKALLEKLELSFDCVSPDIDEGRLTGESPEQLSYRLSQEKAYAVADTHQGLIIASDQVATFGSGKDVDDKILSKPGDHDVAYQQLQQSSGKTLTFLTSLTLLNTNTGNIDTIVEPFKVIFKTLSREQIQNYLKKEQPYDVAGSFKSEGLGITLFERLEGDDPNTLIGLPLIQLTKLLELQGFDILEH